jgi:hypothetical protein
MEFTSHVIASSIQGSATKAVRDSSSAAQKEWNRAEVALADVKRLETSVLELKEEKVVFDQIAISNNDFTGCT